MSRIYISNWPSYIDIDGLACNVAYADFLREQWCDVSYSLSGHRYAASITPTVLSWDFEKEDWVHCPGDHIVLMDVSSVSYLSEYYDLDDVIAVYDHHFGDRDFWRKKLGNRAIIETVGSCATLVYEAIEQQWWITSLSQVSCDLLFTAIVSNTLCFQAQITTQRDRDAYLALKSHVFLKDDFEERYFEEVSAHVLWNPIDQLLHDTKHLVMWEEKIVVAQLELWSAKSFLMQHRDAIASRYKKFWELWFLTLPSISEWYNYLFTTDQKMKDVLVDLIDASFEGDVGVTDRLWLRKEIIKEMIDSGVFVRSL